MNRVYPLQTGQNCVAYAYWVAFQNALFIKDPFKELNFTPEYVESIIGAPTPVAGSTITKLRNDSTIKSAFDINSFNPAVDIFDTSVYPLQTPAVWSSWYTGGSHAVCSFEKTKMYDPALATTLPWSGINVATPVFVYCANSDQFPYKKWYFKFGIVRKIWSIFNKFE